MNNQFKPGDKVKVLVETWLGPEGDIGVVANKNLSEGLISVHYMQWDQKKNEYFPGPIMDFDPKFLELV